jgi:DNA primase
MLLHGINRDKIDRIKSQIDIAAVIAERGIKLKRVGRTLFGLCPFHEEKTPSLAISSHRGLFHCFGCNVGGDVIGFVIRFDRVSFLAAVRLLAERAHVTLDDGQPAAARGEDLCGRKSWQ